MMHTPLCSPTRPGDMCRSVPMGHRAILRVRQFRAISVNEFTPKFVMKLCLLNAEGGLCLLFPT
eukprot:843466-Prymnesium_polylepis.1